MEKVLWKLEKLWCSPYPPFASKHSRPSEIALLFFDTDLFKTYWHWPVQDLSVQAWDALRGNVTWMWHQTMATVLCSPFPEEKARATTRCTEVKAPAGLVGSRDQSPSACSASSRSLSHCCGHYLDCTVLDTLPCILHLQEISQVSLIQPTLLMAPAHVVWVPSREVVSLPNKLLLEPFFLMIFLPCWSLLRIGMKWRSVKWP